MDNHWQVWKCKIGHMTYSMTTLWVRDIYLVMHFQNGILDQTLIYGIHIFLVKAYGFIMVGAMVPFHHTILEKDGVSKIDIRLQHNCGMVACCTVGLHTISIPRKYPKHFKDHHFLHNSRCVFFLIVTSNKFHLKNLNIKCQHLLS